MLPLILSEHKLNKQDLEIEFLGKSISDCLFERPHSLAL